VDGGAERPARIAAAADAARPVWEATGDTDVLRQRLEDDGLHGVDAVLATMRVLRCGLAEAQRAFLAAPCRRAEREFHNRTMDLLQAGGEEP